MTYTNSQCAVCGCNVQLQPGEGYGSRERYGYPPVRLETKLEVDDRHQKWRKPTGRQAWVCGACAIEEWIRQGRQGYAAPMPAVIERVRVERYAAAPRG